MQESKKISELTETTLTFGDKLLDIYKDYYFWKAFIDSNYENSEIIFRNDNISYVFDTIYYSFRDLMYLNFNILKDDNFSGRIQKISNLIQNLDKNNRKEFQIVFDKISLIDSDVIERIEKVRHDQVAHNSNKKLEFGTLIWGQDFTNVLHQYKDVLDILALKLGIKLKNFEEFKDYQYKAVNEFLSPLINNLEES